jgi:AcrR family transcriptional regulator
MPSKSSCEAIEQGEVVANIRSRTSKELARLMKRHSRVRTTAVSALPTRERILHAALRLLRAGGTEAATMRAICDEAGITPPTLYHYFGDMKGLYREVVEQMMRSNAVTAAGLGPKETINEIWDSHVQMATNEPGLFDVWNRHIAWDRLTSTSLHSYETLLQSFQALAKDYPLKMPPKTAAYVFWAAAHGVACLIAASQHDGVPYARGAAENLKNSVLQGIFERPAF